MKKTISFEEFEMARYESDGYCEISNELIDTRKGEQTYKLVYEDPEHKLWIVYYNHHYEWGIQETDFVAIEAEEYEVCETRYREKQ